MRDGLRQFDCDAADLVAQTTAAAIEQHQPRGRIPRCRIALLDCGNKRSVIEELMARDAEVVVLPSRTPADAILRLAPGGIIISNGPGNPTSAMYVVDTIRTLYGKLPMFGVCLGHQLL